MATTPAIADIDKASRDLGTALLPLEGRLKSENAGILCTNDGTDIIVYAPLRYRTTVPSKYNSYKVVFKEWNGEDTEIGTNLILSSAV